MTRTIKVTELIEPAALKTAQAAAYLGICRQTLWKKWNLDPSDPEFVPQLPCGRYAKKDLDAYIERQRLIAPWYRTYAKAERDRHLVVETTGRAA